MILAPQSLILFNTRTITQKELGYAVNKSSEVTVLVVFRIYLQNNSSEEDCVYKNKRSQGNFLQKCFY